MTFSSLSASFLRVGTTSREDVDVGEVGDAAKSPYVSSNIGSFTLISAHTLVGFESHGGPFLSLPVSSTK